MRNVLLNIAVPAARFRFRDQVRLWQPSRPVTQKLAALSGRSCGALRQRLLGVCQQLQQSLTEQAGFVDSALQKQPHWLPGY